MASLVKCGKLMLCGVLSACLESNLPHTYEIDQGRWLVELVGLKTDCNDSILNRTVILRTGVYGDMHLFYIESEQDGYLVWADVTWSLDTIITPYEPNYYLFHWNRDSEQVIGTSVHQDIIEGDSIGAVVWMEITIIKKEKIEYNSAMEICIQESCCGISAEYLAEFYSHW